MAFCPNFNSFSKLIRQIKHSVLIDEDKEKDLRYDVWTTTQKHVEDLFTKGVDSLPGGKANSQHVISKVEGALKRIDQSTESAPEFMSDIIDSNSNIEHSIALHEIMESVKGEADKARNLGIEVSKLTADGVLPVLPLSRVAASIGRKIAFQQRIRFKSNDTDKKTPAEIETMYYAVGNKALTELEEKGYVNLHKNPNTIKDYLDANEVHKDRVKTNITTNKVKGVSLNEDMFGIEAESEEAQYFLNRSGANIEDTQLGVITNVLSAVRQITQPATITMPDKAPTKSMADLAEGDDQFIKIDEETAKIRKKLYDTPVYVHSTIHDLMGMLNKESAKTGQSGSNIIREAFGDHPQLIRSLFGLKRSDDYSVDKKESVSGQNL